MENIGLSVPWQSRELRGGISRWGNFRVIAKMETNLRNYMELLRTTTYAELIGLQISAGWDLRLRIFRLENTQISKSSISFSPSERLRKLQNTLLYGSPSFVGARRLNLQVCRLIAVAAFHNNSD